jgi:hypothetical protein
MLAGERKATCPHCGRAWGGIRHGVTFGGIAVRIIDAVERAGPDGIESDALLELVYGNRPSKRDALKSYVYAINDRLAEVGCKVRIYAGRQCVYRLVKRSGRA